MLRSNRSQRSNRCFTIFSDPIAVDSFSEIIFLCDRIAVSDPIAVFTSDPIASQRSNRCFLTATHIQRSNRCLLAWLEIINNTAIQSLFSTSWAFFHATMHSNSSILSSTQVRWSHGCAHFCCISASTWQGSNLCYWIPRLIAVILFESLLCSTFGRESSHRHRPG